MIDNTFPTDLSTPERILYAAMQIISEQGLKGLSASKLADMAHISKSTVFHYFKKMEEIPPLILKKLYEIINPVQKENYTSIYHYLHTLGKASFSDNPNHIMIYKAFISLYEASMHEPSLHAIVMNCSEEFTRALCSKLQSLCIKPLDPKLLNDMTHLIFTSLDGIALHYLIHKDSQKAMAAWELLIQSITTQYHLN